MPRRIKSDSGGRGFPDTNFSSRFPTRTALPSCPYLLAISPLIRLVHSSEARVEEAPIRQFLDRCCWKTEGHDTAEYAIMLAVVLVIVIGMLRMIATK
jgi:hypothetical protein